MYVYTCTYVCMYLCMYVCSVYVCMYVFVCMYADIMHATRTARSMLCRQGGVGAREDYKRLVGEFSMQSKSRLARR